MLTCDFFPINQETPYDWEHLTFLVAAYFFLYKSLNSDVDSTKYHNLGIFGIYLALIMLFLTYESLGFHFIPCPMLLHLNVSIESATKYLWQREKESMSRPTMYVRG